LQAFETHEKQVKLDKAQALLTSARDETAAQMTGEHVRLLKVQTDMEAEFGQDFIDKTLRDTVKWLLANNYAQRAELLKKDFKVADRQYAWWKLEALAGAGKWTELDAFARTKKAPFGMLVGCAFSNTVPC
jgi:hypothetical protein